MALNPKISEGLNSLSSKANLHPIEVLIEELKCEDLSRRVLSVKTLNTVAIALGPKQTREELLPYLLELLDDDNEVLIALAEALRYIIQSIGGQKYTFVLFDLIEHLLQIDEVSVRKTTLESFESILSANKSTHLMKAVLDLNKRMVASNKVPAKIAAAYLIPCSIQGLNEYKPYIDQFKVLMLCGHPQVRIATGENLKKLVKCEGFIAELLNIATVDQEENVRLLALDALLLCGEVRGLITSLIALFEDDFWRVKQKICENFSKISKFVNNRFELLLDYFKRIIEDKEIEVRLAMCSNIYQVFRVVPQSDFKNYISALDILSSDSLQVKIIFAQNINKIWPYTGKQESLINLLKDLISSYNSQIFLNLLKDIQNFCDIEPDNEKTVKFIMESLAKDRNWRVRQSFLLSFTELCDKCGFEFVEKFLKIFLIEFCMDNAFSVRETVCNVMVLLIQKIGKEWFTINLLEELCELQYARTYIPRMSFLKAVKVMIKEFIGSKVEERMEKGVFYLLGDCVGNVRAYALDALSEIFKASSEDKQQVIRNSLTLLKDDEDLQVQKHLNDFFFNNIQ